MMTTFKTCKRITVFVPCDHAAAYVQAIQDHIPSFLGNYDRVLWHSERGTEQSRKLGSQTTQSASSIKIEFCMPNDEAKLKALIADILVPNHPWEEPVILVQDLQIVDANE